MTSLWDKWGTMHAVTVVRLDRCQVVQQKTVEKEGYDAIQVGAG
jgi:large subunit ribosomal protein L3